MAAREVTERRLAHDDAIHALAFLPSSPPMLASGGIDETLKLWSIASSNPSLTSPTSTLSASSSLACVAIASSPLPYTTADASAAGTPCLLWASFLDGFIRSFSPSSAEFIHAIPSTPASTFSLTHHPSLPLLATAGSTGAVTVYKVKPARSALPSDAKARAQESKELALTAQTWAAELLPSASSPSAAFAYSIAFSATGRYLATGHHGGAVSVYESASSKLLHSFSPHSGPVRALCFSPDDAALYAGGDDGLLTALSLSALQQTASIKAHASFVTAIVAHTVQPSGASAVGPPVRYVVTAGVEGRVKVWDLELNEAVHVFDSPAPVWCLAKHPTEKWVAYGSENGTLSLLQLPA